MTKYIKEIKGMKLKWLVYLFVSEDPGRRNFHDDW